MNVIKGNPKIIIRKFIKGLAYSIACTAITFGINFIPTVEFEPQYAFLSGIIIALLQTTKKALEKYDKRKDR